MQCRACMQMDCVGAVEMSCAISADGKTLYEYFNDCTQLHATSSDNLPKLLCLNCTQSVRSAYNFKETARRSDEELKKILVFPKTEPESIYANTEQPQDAAKCPNDPLSTIPPSPAGIEYAMSIPELDILAIGIKPEKTEELCEVLCEELQDDERGDSKLSDLILEHKFDCPICSMSFKKHSTFRAHVKRVHNHSLSSLKALISEEMGENKPFKCSLCSRQFNQNRSFRDHMKRKHNQIIKKPSEYDEEDKMYNCPICDMSFRSRGAVYSHKSRKHSVKAKTVGRDSSNIDKEKVENGETENSEFIRCKFCNKEIPGNRIKYHEKRHIYALNRKRKYLCSFCPREYKSEISVILHEKKTHLREKPEPEECPICQKKVDPHYLKHHIDNVHTSERKFVCEVCGDSFKSYVLLHYHKRLHFERKFPCTVCTKKFIRSCELKVHMRTHTGEEPYSCHICDRRFKIKARLNYHLQRHAGIKRKCKECGKEFNHVKQLKIHSYKHTGMPYRCSVCDYACAQRDVFRKHLLRMHDVTMTQDEYCAMFKANTGRNPRVKTLEELQSEVRIMEQEELSK